MSAVRRAKRSRVREAAAAGALATGVFLLMLGVLGALERLGMLPLQTPAVGAASAALLTLFPLVIGVKAGFRDDTPPLLRAIGRKLPNARTSTEELVLTLLGGAAWGLLSLLLLSLVRRASPFVGADALTLLALTAALLGGATGALHGPDRRPLAGASLVFAVAVLSAIPSLLLSPRLLAALSGGRAIGLLGNEYHAHAKRTGAALDKQRAIALWSRACASRDAASCFHLATSYAEGDGVAVDEQASQHFARLGCDAPGRDLFACERFVGRGFELPESPTSLACSTEARCPQGGQSCEPSLAQCRLQLAPAGLMPACARLMPSGNGWREIWCPTAP